MVPFRLVTGEDETETVGTAGRGIRSMGLNLWASALPKAAQERRETRQRDSVGIILDKVS